MISIYYYLYYLTFGPNITPHHLRHLHKDVFAIKVTLDVMCRTAYGSWCTRAHAVRLTTYLGDTIRKGPRHLPPLVGRVCWSYLPDGHHGGGVILIELNCDVWPQKILWCLAMNLYLMYDTILLRNKKISPNPIRVLSVTIPYGSYVENYVGIGT